MPLSLNTEITRADYDAFLKHVYAQGRATPGARGKSWLITLLCIPPLAYLMKVTGPNSLRPILFGFIIGCVFMFAFLVTWIKSVQAHLTPLEDGFIFGQQELEATEDGLAIRSPRHQAIYRWSIVIIVVGWLASHLSF